MTGIHLTVPVASFRKGMAREFFETEILPPPATCYGFLLSLVGEMKRHTHVGVRLTAAIRGEASRSVVLRTLWRVKNKNQPMGSGGNAAPNFQQLLTNLEIVLWLDSAQEEARLGGTLEERVHIALDPARRHAITRHGGLCLGESTHLVNTVSHLEKASPAPDGWRIFLLDPTGPLSLPVWVDHVGSAGTRHAVGSLAPHDLSPPPASSLPVIASSVE